jgi:hypothetical protein
MDSGFAGVAHFCSSFRGVVIGFRLSPLSRLGRNDRRAAGEGVCVFCRCNLLAAIEKIEHFGFVLPKSQEYYS